MAHYTAQISIQQHVVSSIEGDDLYRLWLKLLCRMECENSYVVGSIIDNSSSKVVRSCIKQSVS